MLVNHFESAVYGITLLLLVAAAILVVIGGRQAVIQSATLKVSTLEGGILDRILLVLIISPR